MSSKYNKKLRYMQHYKLENILNKKIAFKTFLLSVGLTLILKYLSKPYPPYLRSFDLAISLIFILYLLILRSNIYKGNIIAYYRKDYSLALLNIGKTYYILANMSIGRLITFLMFIKKNSFFMSSFYKGFYHPITTNLVIAISLILFYMFFFQDKYTTIKDYSNQITYRRKELGMYKKEAIKDFIKTKNKEYDIKEFDGVYYDENEVNKSSINGIKEINKGMSKKNNVRRNIRS